MAVYRVERTKNYTVMSNYHLKDKNLTLKAKGLLSMMLSFPEDWEYSTRGLAGVCKEGVGAVGTALKELESAGYMVRRQLRDSNGRISDTEYVIYEMPQSPEPPDGDSKPEPPHNPESEDASDVDDDLPSPDTAIPTADAPDMTTPDVEEPDTVAPDTGLPYTDLPDTENPYTVNPYMDSPYMDSPDTENCAELNIDISSTKRSSTNQSNPSVNPSAPAHEAPQDRTDGKNEVQEKIMQIHEQIGYDRIVTPANKARLDELVEIMLDVAMNRSDRIHIGRDKEYPTAYVQRRFEALNSSHIQRVCDGIAENTTRIKNTKAYLLASLFNAPATTDNHYAMQVNHDRSQSQIQGQTQCPNLYQNLYDY